MLCIRTFVLITGEEVDRDQLLAYLGAYWEAHGYGPSLEEIRRQMGFSSRSHALYHLRTLARQGLLVWEPGKHRTWRPVSLSPPPVPIPLKGVVPASTPDQAGEVVPQDLGTLWLPAGWVPQRCRFALWIRGESMIGLGIRPYDVVLIQPITWDEARPGDMVVVRLRGHNLMTIKQLIRREASRGDPPSHGRTWWLQPAHPDLRPIPLDRRAWALEGRVAFRFGPVWDVGAIARETDGYWDTS